MVQGLLIYRYLSYRNISVYDTYNDFKSWQLWTKRIIYCWQSFVDVVLFLISYLHCNIAICLLLIFDFEQQNLNVHAKYFLLFDIFESTFIMVERSFLNVIILSCGFMLVFTAFQTMGNIEVNVIVSIIIFLF